MVQRIQSIYLATVTLLTASLFYLKLATLSTQDSLYSMFFNGIFIGESKTGEMVTDMMAFSILLFTSVALGIITIFLHKRRFLQIRVAALNIGLQVGLTGLIYFFTTTAGKEIEVAYSFHYPVVFPLISVVLLIMAIRAIGKDEALIRSLDRIR